jgi:hypothetical protein
MNTNTPQTAQSGSLHPICSACGRPFKPWIKRGDGQPTQVCFSCGMLNLASHCEHVEAGDSLKDISEGEQADAFFRSMSVKPNDQGEAQPPAKKL